jgi:hypothetical protein
MGRPSGREDEERLSAALEAGDEAAAMACLEEIDFPREVLTHCLDGAISKKQKAVAKRLLEKGADACYVCSYSDTNYTLLMCASGEPELVECLLEHGAKEVINRTSQKGFTVLDMVGMHAKGETPLYRLLVSLGAKHSRSSPPRRPRAPGETPYRHEYALSVLRSSDAVFDFLQTFDGFDPHYLAAQRRFWSLGNSQASYFHEPHAPLAKFHVAGGYLNHLFGNEGHHGPAERADFIYKIENPLSAPMSLSWCGGVLPGNPRETVTLLADSEAGLSAVRENLLRFRLEGGDFDGTLKDLDHCLAHFGMELPPG